MILDSDLVLVHVNNKPGFYARVEEISPDQKPGWWQVKLLVLTFPLQVFRWILDENQLDEAPFTMDSIPMRLEKLELTCKKRPPETGRGERPESAPTKQGHDDPPQKVISLADRRTKK